MRPHASPRPASDGWHGVSARMRGRRERRTGDGVLARAGGGPEAAASPRRRIEGPGFPARLLLAAVRGYQVLASPLFAGACRYQPSCSHYMAEAVRRHGATRGGWLGIRRLARCHPFGSSGFDPVPD